MSTENPFLKGFSDPQMVARYHDGPRRFVPGLADLHVMTRLLLAESAPENAEVLVLGAGGGLELKAMADGHPGWRFTGVDPAAEMLGLAERTLAHHAPRATLVEGYIDDAPEGPFDAGVCLLTLHFLDAAERTRTAAEIHRRLKPGAPFVAAHSSFPQDPAERAVWIARYMRFAIASGADPEQAEMAAKSIAVGLNMFDPGMDEAILREAGFRDVSLFYAAFTWRGWIARA